MSLAPDKMLQNRYRVVSNIGKGGMGAVYQAWDSRLNIHVALKEMIPQPGISSRMLADLRQQFQQEATVLARMNHPHLIRVTDFFEEGDNAYLVMDFAEGESLAQRIARQGPVPEGDVLAWAAELLDALAYCHGLGIIHRDIKPQNVIIRPNGQAMLVDFGLVKFWDPQDPRTRTAMRGMGTPEYAPPEQYDAASGHTDPRSDLYSLGALLYHTLSGRAPLTATMRIATPEQFISLRRATPGVSRRTEAAVMKALELASSQRWQSAQEMATALGIANLPSSAQSQGRATPAVRRTAGTRRIAKARPGGKARRRIAGWVWAVGSLFGLALLLAVGAVALGVMNWQPSSPSTPGGGETATAVVAEVPEETSTLQPSPSSTPTATPEATSAPTVTLTEEPEATGIPSPTSTRSPTATAGSATPTPTTTTPTPAAAPTESAASPTSSTPTPTPGSASQPASGALITFEQCCGNWRRGNQPNGTLTQSAEQVKTGGYAAKLNYSLPSAEPENFVVFTRRIGLGGQPNGVGTWVYGDGSGHYLNVWIQDAQNDVWQVPMGRVYHTGWKQMAGRIDPNQDWPWAHVSGPNTGAVEYPIAFYALVLDRAGAAGLQEGHIFVDDVTVWRSQQSGNATATPPPSQPATPAAAEPTATAEGAEEPPSSAGPLDFSLPNRVHGEHIEGGHEGTIPVEISGGAPPFTIEHGPETYETQERAYGVPFRTASGHINGSIVVTSADGQRIEHDYWIEGDW